MHTITAASIIPYQNILTDPGTTDQGTFRMDVRISKPQK